MQSLPENKHSYSLGHGHNSVLKIDVVICVAKIHLRTMNKPTVVILIVLFISLHYAATHLELLDFSGNVGLTLGLGESLSFVFNTL